MSTRDGQIDYVATALRHFTGRDAELGLVQRLVDAPDGTALPVLAFHGVGGIGKTWLVRRLREILAGQDLPCATLDFDARFGGVAFRTDSGSALGEIRRQFGAVPCPRFDLAYAFLRYKEGQTGEPMLKGGGAAANAWDFIVEAGTALGGDVPGGNIAAWLARKIAKPVWKRVRAAPSSNGSARARATRTTWPCAA